VPIVQEAGWAPGPVWTGAENLSPTGIRSPGRPAPRDTDYAIPDMVMALTYRKIQVGSVNVVTGIQAVDCKSCSDCRH
jgi:hypothetical protein